MPALRQAQGERGVVAQDERVTASADGEVDFPSSAHGELVEPDERGPPLLLACRRKSSQSC